MGLIALGAQFTHDLDQRYVPMRLSVLVDQHSRVTAENG
jgi:hypothetical protein